MLIRTRLFVRCLRKTERVLALCRFFPLVLALLFVAPSILHSQQLTNVTVTPSNPTAGASAVYTVSFTTSALGGPGGPGVPADGRMRMTFPTGFGISTVLLASPTVGLNGGLITSVAGQVLTMARDNTGAALGASATAALQFAVVGNVNLAGSYRLFVETLDNANARIDSATSLAFNINVGAVDHFAITGIGGSVTAGTPFNFTITAQDAQNNTVTGFTGTLTLSDYTGTLTPQTVVISSNGTVTVNGAIITKAQTGVSITATSGAINGFSSTFTVVPGALDHFTVTNAGSGNIAAQIAGAPFNIRMEARDVNENVITTFTNTVTLSNTTSSITPANSGSFVAGVLASQQVTINKTSTAEVITASGGAPTRTGNSNSFVVNSGVAASFQIDPISTPQTAAQPFGLRITALDANSNVATSFTGTVTIVMNSGSITPTVSTNFAAGVWNGVVTALTSGNGKLITVSNGSFGAFSNSFNVNPGLLDHFEITNISSPQTAGTNFTVTVTARDINNNAVNFSGTVTLSDNTGTLTASPVVFTNQSSQSVSNAQITKAQALVQITASGVGKFGFSNNFAVNAGALDHFAVTNTSGTNIVSQQAGTAFPIRLVAQDIFNNIVTSFNGTVTLANTTTSISPAASVNFSSGVLASQSVTITKTSATEMITVSGGSPTRTGSSNSFVVSHGAINDFTIATISSPQIAGAPFPLTITAVDANQNTVTSFTGTVSLTLNGGGNVSPTTSGNFVAGVWNGNATVSASGTNKSITVSDGTRSEISNTFNVNAAALDHFEITTISSPQTAGTNFSVTVTARDVNNNAVNHTGTVTLSDNTGTLSASPLVFSNQATQTINNANITKAQASVQLTASGSGKIGQSNVFAVNAAALDHFLVTNTSDGDIISPQTAGAAFNIKITAQDQFNNTFTSFTQNVAITDLTALNVTSANFTAGVLASQSVTITQSRNDNQISVTGGSPARAGASNFFNVIAGNIASFTFDTIVDQATGVPFTIVLRARDANGNLATSFNGTATLSDLTGTILPATTGAFNAGIWSGSVTITQTLASNRITATSGSASGQSNPFNITPSSVDHFVINTISSPQTAGVAFAITVTAQDVNNNTVTAFNGSVAFNDLSNSIVPGTSNNFSSGVLTQNVTITKSFTNNRLTVTGLGKSNQSNQFNVNPGPLNRFAIAPISTQTAGGAFAIAVTAQDANSNTVTSFVSTVTISINSGTITPATSGAFSSGVLTQSVTIPVSGNNRIITVSSGASNGSSLPFNVNAGTLDHFVFSAIGTVQAGATIPSFTITAQDINNNNVSFTGTLTLADDTGTLTPANVAMNGTTVSVTTARITKAQTNIKMTASGGGKTGASNLFTVTPGSLSRVKIVAGLTSGDGTEFTTANPTADEEIQLHAAGIDAFGNYIADQLVNWALTPVTTPALGSFSPASNSSFTTFSANKVGTTKIIANHATATDDTTGNITISAGATHHVRILENTNGNTLEIGSKSLNAGAPLTMHASIFDADANYRGDVTTVNWSVTGNIGTFSPAAGPSTVFTATKAGTGTIKADHLTLIDGFSGTITVSNSAVTSIKILEGERGPGGQSINNFTRNTDQTLTVHAEGYDVQGNYVADQNVTWTVSNNIGVLSSAFGSSTTLDFTKPGSGKIFATHNTAGVDSTGSITVNLGAPDRIKILYTNSGDDPEVLDDTLRTGETLIVHASSFDRDGNRIQDISVTWQVNGGIGTLSATSGVTTTLTATTVSTGSISASAPNLVSDATGTITVQANDLDRVRIVEGPAGPGDEFNFKPLNTDATTLVHAAGYDANNNYLNDVAVNWTLTNPGLGALGQVNGASTTINWIRPGTTQLIADHAAVRDDTTSLLQIDPGALRSVKVLNDLSGERPEIGSQSLNADATLNMHAGGFDADGNYLGDQAVNWSVTTNIGTVTPATNSIFTVFSARKIGAGLIKADHSTPSVQDGFSGTITVSPGVLAFIKIIEGLGGANVPSAEVGTKSINTEQQLPLYAAGFDADSNYVGDQNVTWSSTGLTPGISVSGVSTITFSPALSEVSGTIRAEFSPAIFDVTGTISITDGPLRAIKVLQGRSGFTAVVPPTTVASGDTLPVHAGGFDGKDNYIADQIANWTLDGQNGTLAPTANSRHTLFTAGSPGLSSIRATVASLFANSGQINVSPNVISKIVLRTAANNGGQVFNARALTADEQVTIFAAGYDVVNTYLGDFSVAWSNTGNLQPAVSATGSSFTFSPTVANAGGSVNGLIIGVYSPAIKDSTGLITVLPGVPSGNITLTATPSGLPSDGSSTSTIVSAPIKDAENNLTGANAKFTVSLAPVNLGAITTADVDPVANGIQIFTDAASQLNFTYQAGTTGGVVSIAVTSGLNANGSTQISLGSVTIRSVTAAATTVSRGQSGITVSMNVENLSTAPITNLNGQLRMTNAGATDRTGDYTITANNPNVTVPSRGLVTISFTVAVAANANLETITVDGNVTGAVNGTPISAAGAAQKHTWTVQLPAALNISSVSAAEATVFTGQANVPVSIFLTNTAGAATVNLDSVRLVIRDGSNNIQTQHYRIVPEANNPAVISGGGQAEYKVKVDVGIAAPLGVMTLNALAYGKDANSNQALAALNTLSPDQWTVVRGDAFRIVSITPSQTAVTAGMSTDWTIDMLVENTGASTIKLDFAPSKTNINLKIGTTDITSQYTIDRPTSINGGSDLLGPNSTGTLTYTVRQTGSSNGLTGIAIISGIAAGTDNATQQQISDDTKVSGNNGQVTVQSPAALQITQVVTSQPAVTANRSRTWTITATVRNSGESAVRFDSLQVAVGNNQGYTFTKPTTFSDNSSVLGNRETKSLVITVTQTGSQTGALQITTNFFGTETNSSEARNASGNGNITVQAPANLNIAQVRASQPSVTTGQTNDWNVTVVVRNLGGSQVAVKVDTSTNLRFRIGAPFQNDYNVALSPQFWLGTSSLNLDGGATDSLRFVVNTTGAQNGVARLWAKVAATENNSNIALFDTSNGIGRVLVQTPPNAQYATNSLNPRSVNNNSLVAFRVKVRNTGEATVALNPDSTRLRFNSSGIIYDALLDANQVRTLPRNAVGDTTTLTFRREAIPANMPAATYSPMLELRGTQNGNTFARLFNLTNELQVSEPARVQVVEIRPSQGNVTADMTKPWNVTMVVTNNGGSPVRLDSVNLQLRNVTEVKSEYTINIPQNFFTSASRILNAGQTDSLLFRIDRTGRKLGSTVFQARLFMTDQSNQQPINPAPEGSTGFVVQGKSVLRILSLAASQPAVTQNQTREWTVEMRVQNNGGSEVRLDFNTDSTRINLSLNSNYQIQFPDSLLEGGNSLRGQIAGTLRFRVRQTGDQLGRNDLAAIVRGVELNSDERRKDDTQDGGATFVTVQRAAALRVKEVKITGAPNLPFVNFSQNLQAEVTLENPGEEVADSVQVRLTTDRVSTIAPAQIKIIEGVPGNNQPKKVTFNLTASTTATPLETFIANIVSAQGHNTGLSITPSTPIDATEQITVQRPATLQILSVNPSLATVDATQAQWFIDVAMTNTGGARLTVELPRPDNLTIKIGSILQPVALVPDTVFRVSRGRHLTAGQTDTLRYTVSQAGFTQGGQATISAKFNGKDNNDPNRLLVSNEQTGQVNVTSNASVQLVQVSSVANNYQAELALVNAKQDFQVRVAVQNNGSEDVKEVRVRLSTNGVSRIIEQNAEVLIQSIGARQRGEAYFNVFADTGAAINLNPEIFTARVISALTVAGNQPVRVATPTDSTGQALVQRPARLAVKVAIDEIDRVLSGNQVFNLTATMTNLGQAAINDSGEVTVDWAAGANFTIEGGVPKTRRFRAGQTLGWQLRAPNQTLNQTPLFVRFSKTSRDLNSLTLASLAKDADTVSVNVEQSDLKVNQIAITSPNGAADRTVSTGQTFTMQTNISYSQDLVNRVARMIVPPGYTVLGAATRANFNQTETWDIQAPAEPLEIPKFIVIDARGQNGLGEPFASRDSISVVTIGRASLSLTASITQPAGAIGGNLSVNQTFTISASLRNDGRAATTGAAKVDLQLFNGFTTTDTTIRVIAVDGPAITWQVRAPNTALQDTLKVRINQRPLDGNSNTVAALTANRSVVSIPVRTDSSGSLHITEFKIASPFGATDGIVSTLQSFDVQAEFDAKRSTRTTVVLRLPAGYRPVPNLVQEFGDVDGKKQTFWRLQAPVQSTKDTLRIEVTGFDKYSNQAIPQEVRFIPIETVEQARLRLSGFISEPLSARADGIVGLNTTVKISAKLDNFGQALLRGNASVLLRLPDDAAVPAAQDYRTTEDTIKTADANSEVTWQIKARSLESTKVENITLILLTPYPRDINSDSVATVEANRATIPIQTEPKRLFVQTLRTPSRGPVVRGETSALLMRLKLTNEGNSNSSNVLLRAFTWHVRNRTDQPLSANQVIKALRVVDTSRPSRKLAELTSVPASDSMRVTFAPAADTLHGGNADSVDVLVDVSDNIGEAFRLVFKRDADVDAIDQDSNMPVEIIFQDENGANVAASQITSQKRAIAAANYEQAFYNYPNPFDPEDITPERPQGGTYFNYTLSQASDVELRIFTLLGELAHVQSFKSTDPEGRPSPGFKRLFWNGRNGNGMLVLNGVYIAMLKTNDGTATTKVAVRKR